MPPERPFLGDGVRKLGHAKFSQAPAFDTLDSADHPPSIALWTGHFLRYSANSAIIQRGG